MEISFETQKYIKESLEQIYQIKITEQNIRSVVFNHFVGHRKLLKRKNRLLKILDWFTK
jgi:hypothetical protein